MPNAPATARDQLFDWTDENEPLPAPATASASAKGLLRTGILTVLLLAVVAMGVAEMFYWTLRSEIRRKQGSLVNAQLLVTQSRDKQRLSRYQWVKKSDGVLRIPVSLAAGFVIADYAKNSAECPASQRSTEAGTATMAHGGSP